MATDPSPPQLRCVLELEVELPERPRYRLVVDGERPLDFTVDEEPVQLVLS